MSVPAIVIAAYNRSDCLARLLRSVESANYDSTNIPLVISIDKSDVAEVYAIADSFDWKHGVKQIIRRPEQLGLKEHILSCADLSSKFESIILLEDDLLVSPFFYWNAQQALSFYSHDKSIAGISLYSYQIAENRFFPFYAYNDGSSVYFMQLPSSWGEVFTAASWAEFRQWDTNHLDSFPDHILPEYIQEWSVHSWKKRFAAYMIDTDKYFVFPRYSYTTNFGDEGVNTDRKGLFQVPLMLSKQQLQFKSLNDSVAVYDAWFELTSGALKKLDSRFNNYEFANDLHGTKSITSAPEEYLLSSRKCIAPILSFGNTMQDPMQNILCSTKGDFISLGKKDDFQSITTDVSSFYVNLYSIKDIVFNEYLIGLHQMFEFNKRYPKLYIGVIYSGKKDQLSETLSSIFDQTYPSSQISVKIFYEVGVAPFDNTDSRIEPIVYESSDNLFNAVAFSFESSDAEYYVLLKSGDMFHDHALDAMNSIFRRYPDIAWLTGIETIRTCNGYNVFIGNTATRRWNKHIYERNLYKNSFRYIPAAATFWKRYTWDSAKRNINFVSVGSLCEDLWMAFFKAQKLFTCDVYFSSSLVSNVAKLKTSKSLVNVALVEDTLTDKLHEFFFLNNIPYLRTYYKLKNNLPEVIRLEHETQWYFQSDF